MKGRLAKLQVAAADAVTRQKKLKEEKERDLEELRLEYEKTKAAHTSTYDDAITVAVEVETKANNDIKQEKPTTRKRNTG